MAVIGLRQQTDFRVSNQSRDNIEPSNQWTTLPSVEEVALRLYRASQERLSKGVVGTSTMKDSVEPETRVLTEPGLPTVEEIALKLFNAVEERKKKTEELPSKESSGSTIEQRNPSQSGVVRGILETDDHLPELPRSLLEHIISYCSEEFQHDLLKVNQLFHEIAEKHLVSEVAGFIKKDPHFADWEFKCLDDLQLVKQLRINFAGVEEIPASIALLKNLKSLELIGNQITDVPATLQYLPKLAVINLDRNQISTYPAVFAKMNHLKIHLHGNPLPIEKPFLRRGSLELIRPSYIL